MFFVRKRGKKSWVLRHCWGILHSRGGSNRVFVDILNHVQGTFGLMKVMFWVVWLFQAFFPSEIEQPLGLLKNIPQLVIRLWLKPQVSFARAAKIWWERKPSLTDSSTLWMIFLGFYSQTAKESRTDVTSEQFFETSTGRAPQNHRSRMQSAMEKGHIGLLTSIAAETKKASPSLFQDPGARHGGFFRSKMHTEGGALL